MRRPSALIAIVLLLTQLAACGWRLQGSVALPEDLRTVQLIGGRDQTRSALSAVLERNDLELVPLVGEDGQQLAADARLTLHEDEGGQRLLTVTTAGRPREYEVFRVVEFSLTRGEEILVDRRRIELATPYTYSTTDVLARQRESEGVRDALDDRMVRQLLSEVGSALAR